MWCQKPMSRTGKAGAAGKLDNGVGMPRGIAVDVHGHGQAGDMRGAEFHVHLEGRGAAAEARRAYAEAVHQLEQFVFE